MKPTSFAYAAAALVLTLASVFAAAEPMRPGTLEAVAELPFRPGNVAVTRDGRIFATVHPFDPQPGLQLIRITGRKTWRAWPSKHLQSDPSNRGNLRMDSPLGITIDAADRLWIVDTGLNVGETRIWGFDIADGRLARRLALPASIAPAGSFVQDLVVDAAAGWIYLADSRNPALIALRIDDGHARRFSNHPSLAAEHDVELRAGGKPVSFGGTPARVGVNPLTLSADGQTLYFGAMNGLTWYAVPTRLLREGSEADISDAIHLVGSKPVSDGAATDVSGNHFFTDLDGKGIARLGNDGVLRPLVRDERLDWPNSVSFGERGWLYVVANQLHTTPPFTGGADSGTPPYRILRAWTDSIGGVRR